MCLRDFFFMKVNKSTSFFFLASYVGYTIMCLISSLLIDIHIVLLFGSTCIINNSVIKAVFLNC